MRLKLIRKYKNCTLGDRVYCIGKLYVDGAYLCDTIEDKDYGWDASTHLSVIATTKSAHKSKTAIPYGIYTISVNIISPKYRGSEFYQKTANGSRVPRLMNVPGFDGVLIHCGNTEMDSAGCIIVGYNTEKGKVLDSRKAFGKLYPMLQAASKRGEGILLEITK